MKIKDILKLVDDKKLFIEIIDEQCGASYGFFTKQELFNNSKHKNDKIKKINVQYIDNKRLLIIYK